MSRVLKAVSSFDNNIYPHYLANETKHCCNYRNLNFVQLTRVAGGLSDLYYVSSVSKVKQGKSERRSSRDI